MSIDKQHILLWTSVNWPFFPELFHVKWVLYKQTSENWCKSAKNCEN